MTRPADSKATWKRLGWLVACLCLLVGVAQLWGGRNALFLGLILVLLLVGERPQSEAGEAPEPARLAESLRQLAFMTRLGVPLLRALEVLAAHADQAELRRIWSEVGTSVMNGRTLSGALNVHAKVFSRSVIGMVAAGELTGALVQNLEKVSEMLAHEARLKKKVLASLTYPALVLALIVVLSLFTLLVIFPSFAETFRHMNTPLPLVTRLLMTLTNWVTNPVAWLLAVGLAKVGTMQFRAWYARPDSRRQAYARILQVPVFGPILRYASLTRYCWAFEGVLGAGVPLLKGVRLVAVASGNPLIEEDKTHLIEALERGDSLGDYFWDYRDLYHPMIASMVSVGQESRRLDRIFGHLAGWFHTSLETHLEAMSAIIEPFLLLFVGIVTGTTLVAIFLPLYGTLDRF
ncbi:MAG: type II secretion system F family protein [Candidatus Eremiobacteraeota bacterium]|nr:type II secretion system F family protein [Candidatus Eremiobacteraeota bacterium]